MTDPARHHDRSTKGLALIALGLCALFALVVPLFAASLNRSTLFGFPLGFYLAAQGVPVILVLLLAWFANRQNAIDERRED